MVDRDVILEKVKQIQRCLRRIHDKTRGNPASLADLDVQDIFVLNLQRAVQSSIDLAAHVVAEEGLGLPSELHENFSLLEKAGVLGGDLPQRLKRMVGFRNIAVHEYSEIDADVLRSILAKNLKDIEEFYSAVLNKYAPAEP